MWISSLYLVTLAAAVLLTSFAAVSDFRSLTIPNWVSLSIFILYPLAVITSPVEVDWIYGLIVGGAAFIVGFGLFAAGLFGGGDVKLAAALSFWAGASNIMSFLLAVALVGGVLVIVVLIRESFRQPASVGGFSKKMKATLRAKTPIPYGVAIALGSVIVFFNYAQNASVFG